MRTRLARLLRTTAQRLDPQPTIPTGTYEQAKFLADVLSGQFGKGIVGRSMTPGSGTDVSY